jgi:hypothetical protein
MIMYGSYPRLQTMLVIIIRHFASEEMMYLVLKFDNLVPSHDFALQDYEKLYLKDNWLDLREILYDGNSLHIIFLITRHTEPNMQFLASSSFYVSKHTPTLRCPFALNGHRPARSNFTAGVSLQTVRPFLRNALSPRRGRYSRRTPKLDDIPMYMKKRSRSVSQTTEIPKNDHPGHGLRHLLRF